MQIWQNLRNIDRICAMFRANLRNVFCNIYANLREIYGPVCYGTVCSYLMNGPRGGCNVGQRSEAVTELQGSLQPAAGRAHGSALRALVLRRSARALHVRTFMLSVRTRSPARKCALTRTMRSMTATQTPGIISSVFP